MSKKKCSLKVYDGKKTLSGTAAQLKHISESGGWDSFLENYTEEVVRNFSKEVSAEYTKKHSKPKLKIMK